MKFHDLLLNKVDYYIRSGQVSEWDIAAGEALIIAAGGKVFQFDGKTPIQYGQIDKYFLMEGVYVSR